MGAHFGQSISYPLIADGKVFVTVTNPSGGTTLHALDSASGATIWSFAFGGSFPWSAACYENGRVFAVNGSGLLRAFDGATGAVLWSLQLSNQFLFSAPPTVREGIIYTSGAGSGGTLYAVNANTGTLIWTRSVMNGDRSSPGACTRSTTGASTTSTLRQRARSW
ncbi:MAG: PQQ-binding-like beta-propeller repeat protein [Acidobacteria bacterium]|nr:PQQ-binding-like beta-propeller repeat protein [Acidobacteriota bacterium]